MKPDIIDFMNWVYESMLVSSVWRAESWVDTEFVDGQQWNVTDAQSALDSGIEPLVINRVFPIVNLLLGAQAQNRMDISAKGRTSKDGDISQVMTEGIHYVMDQYEGEHKVATAFRDALVPGIGFVGVKHNRDPRQEKIAVEYCDWKEIGWDPFASPWLEADQCRYVYRQRWVDIDVVKQHWPHKAAEIDEAFSEWQGISPRPATTIMTDESTEIEQMKRALSSVAATGGRKRGRLVELWYSEYVTAVYAIMANGNAVELTSDLDFMQFYGIGRQAQEIYTGIVRKMRTATFMGDVLLHEGPTPFNHDEFPFAPFVGYIDRFGWPYGVVRQVRGQNIEINRRRSMALALLKSRRVIAEEGVVHNASDLQTLYKEANKHDGFLVVKDGRMAGIKIEENSELVKPQFEILLQSEREIQQIQGANDELMGYKGQSVSGVAIERRQLQGNTINATLFDNLRRSQKRLGSMIIAEIQGNWKGEKVLRITDRIVGTDKYVELNKWVEGPGGQAVLKNNVTQGKFDIVVSEVPATDTVREQNMNIIMEWMKKSPPELAPYLMSIGMELSNIPNKEQILERFRPLIGASVDDEDLSTEERKARELEQAKARQEAQAYQAQVERKLAELNIENAQLKNALLQAQITKLGTDTQVTKDKSEIEGFKTGFDIQQKINDQKKMGEEMLKANAGGAPTKPVNGRAAA